MRPGRWVAPLVVAALLAISAFAARDACGGVLTGSWREHAGACTLVLEQYDGAYYHLRMRDAQTERTGTCIPGFTELAAGLGRLLAAASPPAEVSLFLGTVAEIPGLSAELVAASRSSPEWDEQLGRPRSGDPNGFIAGLLMRSRLLRDLLPGRKIVGVSVEKVLVPTRQAIRERRAGDGVPDARIPYDAQLWVRLQAMPR